MSDNGSRDLHYHAGDINIDLNAKLKADLAEARADLTATKAQLEANNQSLETYKIKADAAADAQQRLNNTIASLRSQLNAAEEGLQTLKFETNFDQYASTARRAVEEFKAFLTTVNFSDINGYQHDDVAWWLHSLEEGAMTAGEAIAEFKGEYTSYLNDISAGGGNIDLKSFQSLLAVLNQLKSSLEDVLKEVRLIREEGVTTVQAQSGVGGVLEQLQQATQGLSEESKEAYDTIIKLVTGLNDYGNIDASKLYAITNAFISLQNIGSGTFSTKTVENIISMAKQLAAVGQAGPITLSLDVSAIDGVKVSKASLKALAENLPEISKADGDQLQKIFAADPTNGINNIKVSKASLEHLATKLPEITKINSKKLADILNVNTAGINSLKVSKASVENIANLARAAQILKENNVDLTLKGDPSEELNKIAQKMSLIGDAAETAADAVNDLSGALGSRDLEPTEPEGYSPLNGKDLAGSVKSALRLQEVPAENIKEVTKAVAGMRGEFVSATAAWRDYGEEGRHVTSVVVQTATEAENGIQKLTSQVVEFKRNVNEETGEVTWTSKLASGIEKIKAVADSAAQSTDKLIKQNDALSLTKLDDLRLNAEKSIQSALRSGVGDDNDSIDALRTLQSVLGDVESELRNADYSQSAFNEITKEASALIGVHSKQLGFAVQQQKEEAAAVREAEKAKAALVDRTKAQAAVEAELNKVIGPLYGDAIKNGISESDPGMQQLQAYASELYALYDWMQNDANMTQAEFEEHLKNIKAYYSSSTSAVKQSIAVTKEAAKAEKELNKNLASSAKVRESVASAVERYKKAESSSDENVRQSYLNIQSLTNKLTVLEARYKKGDISAEQFKKGIADANAELRRSSQSLDDAGYGVDGLSTKFARLTQELGRFLSPFLLARQAWQTIKQMANVVIELEDAFAQLQIVTGATDKELEEFYSTASDIATNLGKSITDIAKSIEVFSRLGYSLPDATVLAEYATVLSNIASVTTDQATTGLTSIIKGYNMHVEDAEHVSDVLVSIGQKYAVSAGEMMEAYEKAGAALAATNTSFDKSAALIAAANAAVQNSSIVGKVLPMHTVMYV